jgi:hypothetical protein
LLSWAQVRLQEGQEMRKKTISDSIKFQSRFFMKPMYNVGKERK